jgi:hypothetical protein
MRIENNKKKLTTALKIEIKNHNNLCKINVEQRENYLKVKWKILMREIMQKVLLDNSSQEKK